MNDVAIAPPPGTKEESAPLVEWARALTITNADEDAAAGQRLSLANGLIKRIKDHFSTIKRSIDASKKTVLDMEKSELAGPEFVQATIRDKSLAFKRAELEKAQKEQRRLQAIADEEARKKRVAAEEAAAKQRQIEQEARDKAEKARQEAQAATDEAERQRLLKEAAKADRKADVAGLKAEDRAEQAAQVVAPVISVAPQTQKIPGQSIRTTFDAEVIDLKAFVQYVATRDEFLHLLTPNMVAIRGLARSLKQECKLPGVRVFETQSLSSKAS
jgi:hypothetical protein